MNRQTLGMSGFALKMLAIITMLIDHTGATVIRTITQNPAIVNDRNLAALWNDIYNASRSIGRIAFPIFCFFIVEGFLHTRNVRNYAARLFLFALISEVPFDIALKHHWVFPDKQNVYFTLLIGLLVIWAIDFLTNKLEQRLFLSLLPLAAGMWLAKMLNTDYGFKGVFLIAIFYLLHENRLFQCFGGAAAIAWELPAPISMIPIYLYNGKRGRQMKFFFYWFYPVHLMLLYFMTEGRFFCPLFT